MKEQTVRLYHYTKAETLDKILSSGLIRLTALTKTNDPFECTICHPKDDEKIGKELKDLCAKEVWKADLLDDPCLIVSLTGIISSPSMWGHYAESHKGVCLVFDVPVMFYEKDDEIKRAKDSERAIFPVVYQNEKPSVKEIYIDVNRNYQSIIREAISHKGLEWEFEHEVRLVVATGCDSPSKHPDIVWKDGWPHYNGLMGYLCGVILGIKCDKVVSWVKNQLHELKYEGVIVARAFESPTHYKIEVKGDEGQAGFTDSSIKVIKRDIQELESGQLQDRVWFMLPKIAKVREEK